MKRKSLLLDAAFLFALTALGIAVSGYHLGVEDQAIYLPAIEKQLDPALFPHDAELFLAQTRPMLFPQMIAALVQLTHLPVAWVIFIVHIASLFFLLAGCLRLAKRLFNSAGAQWAAVTLISVMLTLPVAGTALTIADQYLHPRAPATALLLFALGDVLERKLARAAVLWILAALIHVQMAFFGAVLGIFFMLPRGWFSAGPKAAAERAAIAAFPLSSLFQPPTTAWREAARTRWYHYLGRWPWPAWVGIFAPLALLVWLRNLAGRRGRTQLADLCSRLLVYGIFVFAASAILTIPSAFERLTPYQPMRGFHLLYIFVLLISGGLLGEAVLQGKWRRWLVLFVPLVPIMFWSNQQTFAASPQIEWPSASSSNPWIESFAWVRMNTPRDAYFALDPFYTQRPGEDVHGFRGFAERSMMADYVKDSGVALLFPSVADRWQREVHARDGWQNFRRADFERLRRDFGVDWVLLERSHPAAADLACPYQNSQVKVCRLD